MLGLLEDFHARIPEGEGAKAHVLAIRELVAGWTISHWNDLLQKLVEKIGATSLKELGKTTRAKNADRRWGVFSSLITDIQKRGRTLLTAGSLDDQLVQYSRYIHHVNECWYQARDCYRAERYPFSAFFSILTLEEVGKLSTLWAELLAYDAPSVCTVARRDPRYNHRKKHFLAACQGALVNSRLDRLLGLEQINKFIAHAESGHLETIRQSCLYAELGGGDFPSTSITEEDARQLCVLSGEVMADVLGHFPWEWERMIAQVKEFEREVGLEPEDTA
jgi:AbiV family abortive infection protein